MNLVDQNLIDFVHDAVGVFGAKSLNERGKPLHVTEHDSHLLALAFYLSSLGKDFISESSRKVFLNLFQFFIKGEVFGGRFRRKS